MPRQETIGVVGAAGSLGSKICQLLENVKTDTRAYDVRGKNINRQGLLWADNISQLVNNSKIIHWCAPADTAATLNKLPSGCLLILHDSVMHHSRQAAMALRKKPAIAGTITIAHCLMNKTGRVAIDSESDDIKRVEKHFRSIGLTPEVINAQEHDAIMAESQALFAVLHEMGHIPELKAYEKRGFLTPSAEALLAALEDRSAIWTKVTLRSLVTNPELPNVIKRMEDTINKLQNGNHPKNS